MRGSEISMLIARHDIYIYIYIYIYKQNIVLNALQEFISIKHKNRTIYIYIYS